MSDRSSNSSALLERATSDYLAVSRGRHLFGTVEDHERAEARAWRRLVAAVETTRADEAHPRPALRAA